jgi:formate dehydrogenase iron-sulfur subunit
MAIKPQDDQKGKGSMITSRREFLKLAGAAGVASAACAEVARASSGSGSAQESWGMLSDLSLCIGCRRCEFACKQANGLPNKEIEEFEDRSVFMEKRRTDENNVTVVNRYNGQEPDEKTVYVKSQCMHCNEPACASACPVAAIRKTAQGPVVYDASLCIGCRYCLMACPFSMPAYTYDVALAPVVRKCTMCFERVSKNGGVPACAQMCPVEAITFGKRGKLLALARQRIQDRPGRYVNYIYGEREVGGTSWLYLSPRPFEQLGFRMDLGTTAYPELTAGFMSIVPLIITAWPAVLAGVYALTGHHEQPGQAGHNPQTNHPPKGA